MSRLFKFLSDAISRPVLECPATFVFLTVLVWAPSWTREISVASLFYVFCNLLFSSAAVFLICLVAHLLGRVGRPFKLAWLGISHVLVYGVFFFECFLMFFFGCHTNANVFQLIEETNPQETSEFFTVYVLNGKFFALCAVMILFAVVEFFAKKIVASLLSLRSCRFAPVASLLSLRSKCLSSISLVRFAEQRQILFARISGRLESCEQFGSDAVAAVLRL